MIRERAMELVAALRSGNYIQGKNRLYDNGAYCCLGVACLVAGKSFDDNNRCEEEGEILPISVQEYFDFFDKTGGRRDQQPFEIKNNCRMSCLTEANDGGKTFEQIADFIEKNWEQL
jgi:hypothetical protein